MYIDYEQLRQDLINYYGTLSPIFPAALIDVSNIEYASYEELISMASEVGLDINQYVIYSKKKKR